MDNIVRAVVLLMILSCVVGVLIVVKRNGEKEKFWNEILLIFGIVISAYICMVMSRHYSVDSFNVIYDNAAYWNMQLGRYLNSGEIFWEELFGLNQVLAQRFFAVLWMGSVTLSIFIIDCAMKTVFEPNEKWKRFVITIAVSLAFVNIFMMEFVLFPEMMAVNIFGKIALSLSIWFALKEDKLIKKWSISFIFLIIALGNYQSYIGIFEAFVLMGIFFAYRSDRKEKYKNLCMTLLVGGLASAFNIIFVKLLVSLKWLVDSGRGAELGIKIILKNVEVVFQYQKRFWYNADGIMPKLVMPLLGLFILLIIWNVIREMSLVEKIEYILIIVTSYLLGFAPHIVESRILLTPRSNLAIWAVIAAVMISGTQVEWRRVKYVLEIGCTSILLINIFVMQDMAANNQMVNAADFVEADQICEAIKKYEAESGNEVKKIAVGYDTAPTVYQPFSRYKNSELGARILVISYSDYRLIGYKLGRPLEKVDMPEMVFNKYFSGKDWSCLDVNEQMNFENDTAYLVIY